MKCFDCDSEMNEMAKSPMGSWYACPKCGHVSIIQGGK